MKQPLTVTGAGSTRWILHPPVDPYGDGYVAHLPVELCDEGFHVRTLATIDASAGTGLGAFLHRLAENWCDWSGRQTWDALEREMTIEASHDGSYVTLDVTVRRPRQSQAADAWSAAVSLTLESGEQMTALAGEVRKLLG